MCLLNLFIQKNIIISALWKFNMKMNTSPNIVDMIDTRISDCVYTKYIVDVWPNHFHLAYGREIAWLEQRVGVYGLSFMMNCN